MSEAAIVRFISVRDVVARTSLSRTTLWRLVRAGQFPKPRPLTAQRIAFVEAEVSEWLRAKATAA